MKDRRNGMLSGKKELLIYETQIGSAPFEEWLDGLRDRKARAIIRARLDRLEYGHAGKCEPVGNGVYELKIHFGPGYRVYFGEDGKALIILLCAGNKSTQERDIHKAKAYWSDYEVRR